MNSVIHMLFAQEGRKITFLNPKLSIPWTHLGHKCVSGFLICPLLFGVNMWCLQYVYQYVSQDRLHCTTITHDPLKSKCLNLAGNMVTQKPRLVGVASLLWCHWLGLVLRVWGCKKRCDANHNDRQVSFEPLYWGRCDVKGGWEVLQGVQAGKEKQLK